jgi:hypothetical protein
MALSPTFKHLGVVLIPKFPMIQPDLRSPLYPVRQQRDTSKSDIVEVWNGTRKKITHKLANRCHIKCTDLHDDLVMTTEAGTHSHQLHLQNLDYYDKSVKLCTRIGGRQPSRYGSRSHRLGTDNSKFICCFGPVPYPLLRTPLPLDYIYTLTTSCVR